MGFGGGRLRPALLPQPVLLVPPRAALYLLHLRSDRRRAPRPPNGGGAPAAGLLPGAEVGIHPQPGEVQREGARADYDLRQLGGGQPLLHPCCQRRQDILPAEVDFLGGARGGSNHAGFGLRVGRPSPAVPGGARCNVVAAKSRSGVSVQVPSLCSNFLLISIICVCLDFSLIKK